MTYSAARGAGEVADIPWNRARVAALCRAVARDRSAFELLSHKDWRWVFRCPGESGTSVVLKLWERPSVLARVQDRLGRSSRCREHANLLRARAHGLAVPAPLGTARLGREEAPFTAALVLEDLGATRVAVDHVKELFAADDRAGRARFEEGLLALTEGLLAARMLDTDHGLVNTLVPAHGRPVRIDFEMSRTVLVPRLCTRRYAAMLGHFLTTYVFAAQPRTEPVVDLARRLADRLAPPGPVLARARAYVEHRLAVQRDRDGIDVRVELPW